MVGARGLVIGYGQEGKGAGEGLVGASEEVTLLGSIGHDCTHCMGNGSLGGVPSTPDIYGCICRCSQCCAPAFIVSVAPLLRWWMWLVGGNMVR